MRLIVMRLYGAALFALAALAGLLVFVVPAWADEHELDDLPSHALRDMRDYAQEVEDLTTAGGHAYIVEPTLLWHPHRPQNWWKPETTQDGRVRLRVAFLGGSPEIHALIEGAAKEWTKYAHVDLDFREPNGSFRRWSKGVQNAGEIRISFVEVDEEGKRRTWSNVGQLSAKDRTLASMNFDTMSPSADIKKIVREWPTTWEHAAVIHEFGHALGLRHEHFHKVCQANVNWQTLFRTLQKAHPSWTAEQVDRQIKVQYQGMIQLKSGKWVPFEGQGAIQSQQPDKYSIMMYRLDPSIYYNRVCYPPYEMQALSDGDKAIARHSYPSLTVAIAPPTRPQPTPPQAVAASQPPFSRPESEHACSNFREGWTVDDYIKACTRMIQDDRLSRDADGRRMLGAALVDRAYFYRERYLDRTANDRSARLAAILREGGTAKPLPERTCGTPDLADLTSAIADLTRAIAEDRDYALALSNRAAVYMVRRCVGDAANALRDFKDAADWGPAAKRTDVPVLSPSFAELDVGVGFASLAQCAPDQAIEAFASAIAKQAAITPSAPAVSARAYFGMGLARKLRCNLKNDSSRLADRAEGERLMETALSWNPAVRQEVLREYGLDDAIASCRSPSAQASPTYRE